jgi:hypothetical protein
MIPIDISSTRDPETGQRFYRATATVAGKTITGRTSSVETSALWHLLRTIAPILRDDQPFTVYYAATRLSVAYRSVYAHCGHRTKEEARGGVHWTVCTECLSEFPNPSGDRNCPSCRTKVAEAKRSYRARRQP